MSPSLLKTSLSSLFPQTSLCCMNFMSYKWNHDDLSFCDWITSRSIVFRVDPRCHLWRVSFLWRLNNITLYVYPTFSSPSERHWRCFRFLGIVNNAATGIESQRSTWTPLSMLPKRDWETWVGPSWSRTASRVILMQCLLHPACRRVTSRVLK